MANNFANDPDVVALYRFESGALTTDSSGNGNTLTNVNTVEEDTTNEKEGDCCADFTKAKKEFLYRTDTNLSSNFPLKSGTNNKKFTISAWIRLKSKVPFGAYYAIFSKHGSGLASFWMALNGDEKLRFCLGYNKGDSEELSAPHPSALSTNTWYHVTISYDDSDRSFAIRVRDANGSVVGTDLTGNTTNNINVENGIMSIGAVHSYGGTWIRHFDGLIDELVVFKRVLSATEITAIAKGQYKSYEESVSDLFKASDSQDSIRKLEFANSDSFSLSEEIVAIGKFPKSISDLFKVADSLVNSTKFSNSASDLIKLLDLSSSAKGYIENISDLFKVSEGLSPVIKFIESVSDKALFVDSSTGNLIIALSVSDAAKFIDSSIMSQGVYIYNVSDFFTLKDSSSVAGKLIVAVSEEFKLSDFTDGKKKTQFSISDIFKLSDLGVTKKLSSEDVSDFLRVIDNGESVKRAILEVSDKFKMSDYSIFMTLDDLGLVAIKLVYRGKNFLTLKERKDFTFKNRTSFFTTKKE